MSTETLIEQRRDLTTSLSYCERGAFPGSRAWREEKAALDALAAFDAAHPEVIAEINRRHSEQTLGGKDIYGM
jgi:hypothetical protein